VCDVSDDRQVSQWADQVLNAHGPPDLLLNNAAMISANAELWQVPPAEFSRLVDVNVKGVFYVIRHFVPAMIERNTGVIVNFSSGWGRSAEKDVGPYVATKWAIEGLTQALALELPPGIAVVALNPGIVNTDMLQSCFGESAAHYPSAARWAETAVPFILKLDGNDNGHALTAPE